jgi:virginiamycin B lyase
LPFGITAGPDGALWFTEAGANKIGRITTTGRITEYPVPTADARPSQITTGPDGALWFTESYANKIGRITTTGTVTEYPVPTAGAYPTGIAAGPDGALWFTEINVGKVGRIYPSGAITEFPTGRALLITAGPDGALWFTEGGVNIGRITTTGDVSHFTDPLMDPANELLNTFGITAGPDGALWYSVAAIEACCTSSIGRITTAGSVTHFDLNGPLPPGTIIKGPDGALWFERGAGVGRITTGGAISGTVLPRETAGIAAGSDGAVWFTDYSGGKVGRITTSVSRPSVDPLAPTDGATEVLPNRNALAVFSEAMDHASTEAAFSMKRTSDGQPVPGSFSWYGKVLIFDPAGYLLPGTRYTVSVGGSAKGASGRPLANPKRWSFETTSRPVFDPFSPRDGAAGVATGAKVYTLFDKAMSHTATQQAFSLERTSDGRPVAGAFAWDESRPGLATVLIFDPSVPLAANTQYTASVAGTATDTAGRTLANPGSWKFKTGPG